MVILMPYLLGIDKTFGNIIVGLVTTNFDTDLTVTANGGTYKADGNTYGIYAGINTGVLMLWLDTVWVLI